MPQSRSCRRLTRPPEAPRRAPFAGKGGAGACSILANADRPFGRAAALRPHCSLSRKHKTLLRVGAGTAAPYKPRTWRATTLRSERSPIWRVLSQRRRRRRRSVPCERYATGAIGGARTRFHGRTRLSAQPSAVSLCAGTENRRRESATGSRASQKQRSDAGDKTPARHTSRKRPVCCT